MTTATNYGNVGVSTHDFAFHVEQWTDDDQRVEEILGLLVNATMAQAAYHAAVQERRDNIIYLRRGAHVLKRHVPDRLRAYIRS